LARNLASYSIDGYYHDQPIFLFGCTHHFTGLTTTFLRRRSMNSVKNLVFTALLLSVLCVNAFAGDMNLPGYTAPPPPPTQEEHMTTSTGTDTLNYDPYAEQYSETTESSDYLLFDVVTALLSVY
jgi:hypothetical protein